jgi:diguanylate cyclase (GGDEF)-like protein/PAS domain S-box-containing protein
MDHLKEDSCFFRRIVEIVADAVVVVDKDQRITLFNRSAERIFGYKASEVLGRSLDLLIPFRFLEAHRAHIRSFGAGPETGRFMEDRASQIFGRRKDGTEFPAEVSISKLTSNGETLYTAILRDITERARTDEAIRRLAYYDTLTGLPNRTVFQDLLGEAILQARQDHRSAAVLLMDLNRFQEINDTLGHPRGDLLLQAVGKRLQQVLRPTDTVARLGGDEFGVLLTLRASSDAVLVAKKIEKGLEDPIEIEGIPVQVEPSSGIAFYPDHGETADSLLQRADVALYASKRSGNAYAIYNPEKDPYSPRRLALIGELRQAMAAGQLFLVYQPKTDLRSGGVMGIEALVRWQHPTLGLIPPDQFILPAEQTGLIKSLTPFILRTAMRQCTERLPLRDLKVAVNLSVRNLLDPELPDQIHTALRDCGMAPDRLELEITESAIMADVPLAMHTITTLTAEGIGFSIDDFGTGYSSLVHLKRLPVASIKIDRIFVKDLLTDEENEVIVRSTIEMAHNLDRKVIAEGVESGEALDRLAEMGCDEAQGFHISRPLTADDLMRWLDDHSRK